MLTLPQFEALAESYGADLKRWPEEMRSRAEALVQVSPSARKILEHARAFDAQLQVGADPWPAAERDAALVRLRSGVAGRIAVKPRRTPFWQEPAARAAAVARLGWISVATGSGIAIATGLLIGAMYTVAPASDTVFAMLDPAPILAPVN